MLFISQYLVSLNISYGYKKPTTTAAKIDTLDLARSRVYIFAIFAIVGKDHITDQMRLIFSMPAKYGGLGILEPESVCSLEYESSIKATCQLTNAIFSQQQILKIDEEAQQDTMKEVKQKKDA